MVAARVDQDAVDRSLQLPAVGSAGTGLADRVPDHAGPRPRRAGTRLASPTRWSFTAGLLGPLGVPLRRVTDRPAQRPRDRANRPCGGYLCVPWSARALPGYRAANTLICLVEGGATKTAVVRIDPGQR
jgi:hypothetical protein